MAEARTLAGLIASIRSQLIDAGIADAALDARLLVEAATGTTRIDAVREPGREVGSGDIGRLDAFLARRLSGEPVHRILGHREFHGIDLLLNEATLEPRDDTEAVVDLALKAVGADRGRVLSILDLGTGTGAIALALLAELPHARATGVDLADRAVQAARDNAERGGLADRFSALQSDWFDRVPGRFDLIVSNPPYIPSDEIAGLAREVRLFDPASALDGGQDGLDAFRTIAQGAASHLGAMGCVVVEIGAGQERAVETIFLGHGFRLADATRDLGGHTRALAFAAAQEGEQTAK